MLSVHYGISFLLIFNFVKNILRPFTDAEYKFDLILTDLLYIRSSNLQNKANHLISEELNYLPNNNAVSLKISFFCGRQHRNKQKAVFSMLP